MQAEENNTPSLDQIIVDRTMIEELYTGSNLKPEARQYALDLISPPLNWGLWTSRILLGLGTTLILAGIIFFFAYNWTRIGDFAKLGGIQLAIIACIIAACFLPLQKLPGKLLLLSASILVGVFMAVFGQIYQTGADAWQLFFFWTILTLGWTVISNFPAQWIFSLVIANLAISTWWAQAANPSRDMINLVDVMFITLNGSALIAFEICKSKKIEWLDNFWLRPLLTFVVLYFATSPLVARILFSFKANSLTIAAILGAACLAVSFTIYRYKLRDIKSLSLTVLAICIVIITAIGKLMFEGGNETTATFIMGVITLGVFAAAVTYIRKISKHLEA